MKLYYLVFVLITLFFSSLVFAADIKVCGDVYQADCSGNVLGPLEYTTITGRPDSWVADITYTFPSIVWHSAGADRCLSVDPGQYPFLKFEFVGFRTAFVSFKQINQNDGEFEVKMQRLECEGEK